MPLVEELLNCLQGASVFSALDMCSGYHQIKMDPNDSLKTAFAIRGGNYAFKVMPFGLRNAPATFQRCLEQILAPFLFKFVIVYCDDILVYSSNTEEHLQHLNSVFSSLRRQNCYIKISKCKFAMESLDYLGFIISENTLSKSPSKINAILHASKTRTVKDVRSFLGILCFLP